MKFGHNLYRNVVPEWAPYYIDYKALKKRIKKNHVDCAETEDSDLAPFFFAVDRELEKVDTFYNKRASETLRRLKLLNDKYGEEFAKPQDLDRDEVTDLVGILLELRSQLRKIAWYADINRRGFVKILKKLDKKINTEEKTRYVNSKVQARPFASSSDVAEAEKKVNEWLAQLGDEYAGLATSKEPAVNRLSTKIVSTKAAAGLTNGYINTLDNAMRDDHASILEKILLENQTNQAWTSALILNLLQRALTAGALSCVKVLLGNIDSLEETDDINGRNVMHRLVINIGRNNSQDSTENTVSQHEDRYFIHPADTSYINLQNEKQSRNEDKSMGIDQGLVKSLMFLLEHIKVEQRPALTCKDALGRIPLHYAAQYGNLHVCEILFNFMQRWAVFAEKDTLFDSRWQDNDGQTPLHLAVAGKHPKTLNYLLHAEKPSDVSEDGQPIRKSLTTSSLLFLAVEQDAAAVVRVLVQAGITLNEQNDQGETALHIAANYGFNECARIIMTDSDVHCVNLEVAEPIFGWTPLFIAAVEGNRELVDLFIERGAEFEKADQSGWTAMEHAALRGHLEIARRLHEASQQQGLRPSTDPKSTVNLSLSSSTSSNGSPPGKSILEDGSSQNKNGKKQNSILKGHEPVKSFGHRYLKKNIMILVTLGSVDIRKNIKPIELDTIPLSHVHATQLDTALSLVVSATNVEGDKTIIDLPVQDQITTDPIAFETQDLTKVKLKFDLIPTYSGAHDKIIGRAVALLSSIKLGSDRTKVPLQGCLTVPILGVETLDVIGSVNFEFMVITPFSHPQMSVAKNQTYWKSLTSPQVIGHRGLGKNTSRKSLQLGENTLQSFISAANLGASYVEFDVQVTKDHVPVLYHDFLVGETGIDAPVHSLTLEQFMHTNAHHLKKTPRSRSPANGVSPDEPKPLSQRPRAMSLGPVLEDRGQELQEKMRYTRALKVKGFKGNVMGSSIQGPFQTLEGVFKDLPAHIGFNIELKYPMLHESEAQDMDTFSIEMNTWVDAVLKVVYDHVKERDLIFSSFNPDICLMLSFKQPSIPILFLTEAGTEAMYDIRTTSLKEAIRFASRWNLLGVVSAAEPAVLCPRLVRVVKESGLVFVTYGTLNNDPQNVKLQVNQGIDAVIVDSVLAIRKGLTA